MSLDYNKRLLAHHEENFRSDLDRLADLNKQYQWLEKTEEELANMPDRGEARLSRIGQWPFDFGRRLAYFADHIEITEQETIKYHRSKVDALREKMYDIEAIKAQKDRADVIEQQITGKHTMPGANTLFNGFPSEQPLSSGIPLKSRPEDLVRSNAGSNSDEKPVAEADQTDREWSAGFDFAKMQEELERFTEVSMPVEPLLVWHDIHGSYGTWKYPAVSGCTQERSTEHLMPVAHSPLWQDMPVFYETWPYPAVPGRAQEKIRGAEMMPNRWILSQSFRVWVFDSEFEPGEASPSCESHT